MSYTFEVTPMPLAQIPLHLGCGAEFGYTVKKGRDFMASYVSYSMHGFNRKNKAEISGNCYEVTLTDNVPYIYQNHSFLDSMLIDDHVTRITFYLKAGTSYEEHMNEIHIELEQICYNLIAYSDLPICQPYCLFEMGKNEDGTEIEAHDHLSFHDEAYCFHTTSAGALYNVAFKSKMDYSNHEATYKEIFMILQSPYKSIQFMGLYDIMANLIHNPISQEKVHDYFGKNKDRYPFIKFIESRKNPNKHEDSLTNLRNAMAHSKQTGISEYLNISNRITNTPIKWLLIVINDLLCRETDKN